MRGGLKVINNEMYLKKLLQFKDHFSIKVITGIRGVGKTTLLSMFAEALKENGVSDEQIISINFDEMAEIHNFQQLYEFVNEKIVYLEQAYLLLDEIQQVKGWEKAINAFFVGSPVDIYITGSNSEILSKDFLHLLSEHYELIQMKPLPFNEYLTMVSKNETQDKETYFQQYLKFGGLPIAAKLQGKTDILPILLNGIYNTILNKDIISRYGVRDAVLLNSMNKFLAVNEGKPISLKLIGPYLENMGHVTTGYTIDNYLKMINESGLFHRVNRYDIKSKTTLNGSERFYCADLGLCNALLNFSSVEEEVLLENAVCIELWRRGYEVFAGKIGGMNITFAAFKDEQPSYFQIASSLDSKSKLRKVLYPLQRINDQYSKTILSMDRPKITDYNGIKVFNIFDFLIGNT